MTRRTSSWLFISCKTIGSVSVLSRVTIARVGVVLEPLLTQKRCVFACRLFMRPDLCHTQAFVTTRQVIVGGTWLSCLAFLVNTLRLCRIFPGYFLCNWWSHRSFGSTQTNFLCEHTVPFLNLCETSLHSLNRMFEHLLTHKAPYLLKWMPFLYLRR